MFCDISHAFYYVCICFIYRHQVEEGVDISSCSVYHATADSVPPPERKSTGKMKIEPGDVLL